MHVNHPVALRTGVFAHFVAVAEMLGKPGDERIGAQIALHHQIGMAVGGAEATP